MKRFMSRWSRPALALSACLLGSLALAQVQLTYLTHWPPDTVARLEAAIERYEADHPDVRVTVRAVPFGNLLSTLRTQAGTPSGPTIAGIYELWLPELVANGIAAPAPEAQAGDVRAHWSEGLAGSASVEGEVYGYPNEVNLYALNYNTRLFEEAGLSGPPATWDELVSYAEALTKRDGGVLVQQGFGLINSWPAGVVHPWLSLVYSNGGTLLDGTEPQLTDAAARAVTELYHRLIFDAGVTDPAMGTANASTTGPFLQNFANGQTAMIIMANWWQSALRDSMGDAFADIATAPIPVGPDGDASRPVSYAWLNVVNANADEAAREAAWAFQQWLNSPESGEEGASAMGDILMSMGILPSRGSDIDAHRDALDTPFLQGYVAQLDRAVPFPTVLGGEEMTNALQGWIERMEFGQVAADEAMRGAQDDIEAILERHY